MTTTTINLDNDAQNGLEKALLYLKAWRLENEVPFGVAQIAAGAALVALGVQNGAIEIGVALLPTCTPIVSSGGTMGFLGGFMGGGWAGSLLGSIGVVALGSGIGIPAVVVAGGAACILGLAGYAVGDIAHNIMFPGVDPLSLVMPGSLLLVGTYLMIKGAREVLDATGVLTLLKSRVSKAKDGALTLKPIAQQIVARTKLEWAGYTAELAKAPRTPSEALAMSSTVAACGAGGLAVGTAVATSSVTLLGSSTLGSIAVSAGLATPPLWPVIAGVAIAGGIGYSAFKGVSYLRQKK